MAEMEFLLAIAGQYLGRMVHATGPFWHFYVRARNGVIGADYQAKFIKAEAFRTPLLNESLKGAPSCPKKKTTRPR